MDDMLQVLEMPWRRSRKDYMSDSERCTRSIITQISMERKRIHRFSLMAIWSCRATDIIIQSTSDSLSETDTGNCFLNASPFQNTAALLILD